VRYLLDRAKPENRTSVVPPGQRDSTLVELETTARIDTVRYVLPAFIDFSKRDWHRTAAPYAHYVVEGSLNGERWVGLADRWHGPWCGIRTDSFPPIEVRYLHFNGIVSTREPFPIRNVEAFSAVE
jgi:hypothetical protein